MFVENVRFPVPYYTKMMYICCVSTYTALKRLIGVRFRGIIFGVHIFRIVAATTAYSASHPPSHMGYLYGPL